jgi:hypothetical protein
MKSIILSCVIALISTSFVNAECVSGTCSTRPIQKAGVATLNVTKRIVTYPFRVVNKARTNRINRVNGR